MVGEYNGIIIHEAYRIPNGVHSSTSAQVANTKRAVVCGAQSALVAYGRKYSGSTKYKWKEELTYSSVVARAANDNCVNSGEALAA